jgi:signal transduction histidine kinase
VRAHAGLEVEVDLPRDPGLAPEASIELLSIVREALSNIVRHADARRIVIRALRRRADLVMRVSDDGHGFTVSGVGPGHHGLRNMERRAERLGGAFEVRSSKRAGTRIIITLPVPAGRQKTGGPDRA